MRQKVFSLVALLMLPALPVQAACPDGDLTGLKAAVSQTLSAVATADSDEILAQFSHEGVVFGSDGPVTSHAYLEQDFSRHGDYYCSLFTCDGKRGNLIPLFSNPYKTQILLEDESVSGLADFGNLELDYIYTAKCRWELISVIYL